MARVFDAAPASAKRVIEAYQCVTVAGSYQEILSDPEIAGVVLATPAATHYELAMEALDAGKDVPADYVCFGPSMVFSRRAKYRCRRHTA